MIVGLGIDLVEVERIRSLYEKHGERFLSRILRPDEIAYCLSHREPAQYLAVRFAAKEAIAKAFGTGISAELSWQDMEIGRRESGQPFVILHGAGQKLQAVRGVQTIWISLSHTAQHATAVAVLESAV
jgi:holo-[acyl-carrier protein] synthase